MTFDRRHSGRVDINSACKIHVSHSQLYGVLMNISEDGVAILLDSDVDASLLGVGKHIQFCCKDSCHMYDNGRMVALQGDAYIMRLNDNPRLIGCRMSNLSPILNSYIQAKRLSQLC